MKKFPIILVRATRQVLGCDNKFFGWKKLFWAFATFAKAFFVALEVRGWCHSCQLLHHSWRQKVQSDKNSFSAQSQLFLAFSTFEKALLWLERWGGGVTSATFCITRGDESAQRAPSLVFPFFVGFTAALPGVENCPSPFDYCKLWLNKCKQRHNKYFLCRWLNVT